MKYNVILAGIILMSIIGGSIGSAFSQTTTQNIWITPDNPLYGLKLWMEKVHLALTFNETKKMQLELKYMEERMVEAQLMLQKNNTVAYQKAMQNYEQLKNQFEYQYQRCMNNPECQKMYRNMTEMDNNCTKMMERVRMFR